MFQNGFIMPASAIQDPGTDRVLDVMWPIKATLNGETMCGASGKVLGDGMPAVLLYGRLRGRFMCLGAYSSEAALLRAVSEGP